jgi:hypothetical protein
MDVLAASRVRCRCQREGKKSPVHISHHTPHISSSREPVAPHPDGAFVLAHPPPWLSYPGACHADSRRYRRRVCVSSLLGVPALLNRIAHPSTSHSPPRRRRRRARLLEKMSGPPVRSGPSARAQKRLRLGCRTAGIFDLKDAWKRRFHRNRQSTCGWSWPRV